MHYVTTDNKVKFYTGFRSRKLMSSVFMLSKSHSSNIRYWSYQKRVVFYSRNIANRRAEARILTFDEELMMTFMRIRLGLLETYLADRFDVSIATVSRIITTLIKYVACQFKSIIFALPQEKFLFILPNFFSLFHIATFAL